MKKNNALLLVLILVLLTAISGCGNNTTKDLLNKSIDKVKAAKSYKFEGQSIMKVNNQQAENLKFSGAYKAPIETYTKDNIDYLGQTIDVETYQKDNNNFYTKTTDKWDKMSATDAKAIKNSGAGGNPTDMLKDMMNNAKTFTLITTKTINGKKYKIIKITAKADKLKENAKKDVLANFNEMSKQAKPEDKKAIDAQKKQMDQFLKTMDIKVTYHLYIDSVTNDLWKVEMDQTVSSVIEKKKTVNNQLFNISFKDYNKPVTMPDVTK